jgi:hypothetical protein
LAAAVQEQPGVLKTEPQDWKAFLAVSHQPEAVSAQGQRLAWLAGPAVQVVAEPVQTQPAALVVLEHLDKATTADKADRATP